MTARVLPEAEWHRLPAACGVLAMRPFVRDGLMRVIVAEDGGRIVGTWAVLMVPHLEGVWIDPAYRKRVSVVRRLVTMTFAVARAWGAWAWTGAVDPTVRALLVDHLKAQAVPGESFIVPLGEG